MSIAGFELAIIRSFSLSFSPSSKKKSTLMMVNSLFRLVVNVHNNKKLCRLTSIFTDYDHIQYYPYIVFYWKKKGGAHLF